MNSCTRCVHCCVHSAAANTRSEHSPNRVPAMHWIGRAAVQRSVHSWPHGGSPACRLVSGSGESAAKDVMGSPIGRGAASAAGERSIAAARRTAKLPKRSIGLVYHEVPCHGVNNSIVHAPVSRQR